MAVRPLCVLLLLFLVENTLKDDKCAMSLLLLLLVVVVVDAWRGRVVMEDLRPVDGELFAECPTPPRRLRSNVVVWLILSTMQPL